MSPSKRQKLGAVTHEVFTVQGINGKSTMNRLAYDEYRSELNGRRAEGRYTLEEAAMQIAEATGERADAMLHKLLFAVRSGQLEMYAPGKRAKYIYGEGGASRVRDFYEEAYWHDLNAWLADKESKIAWQFPDPKCLSPSAKDKRPKWQIPDRLEYKAREIGEKWMNAQSKKPGVDTIAKHVEGKLKDRNLMGPRGDYWDWQTIKKEALKGITGRKATGKK